MDKGYFPYGNKSKEFLIKRTIFLCNYLKNKGVDKIILACNTISIVALPFVKMLFDNVVGVFEEFLPYINNNSVFIASKRTCIELSKIYNNKIIDGTMLIEAIENNKDYTKIINIIDNIIGDNSNLILACTHFLGINKKFLIPAVKNNNKHL